MPFLHPIVTTSTYIQIFPQQSTLKHPQTMFLFTAYVSTEQLNLIFEGSHFIVRLSTVDNCVHSYLRCKMRIIRQNWFVYY